MNWLADFHFLRPLWLLALPLLLFFLFHQRHRFSQRSAWSQVIDPSLLPHLLQGQGAQNPTRGVLPMALLAAVLLVGALAGPSWRQLPQPVFDAPLHRVLVMDLSPAMDAQDIKPSRLKRAQLLAQQLLDQQTEGDTALVAFAADAYSVVPLTSDRGTVSHLLHSLSTDIMPAAGQNLAAGIRQAQDLLQQAGAVGGDIVLLTASPVNRAAQDAADDAHAAGFRLHVLGAGTPQGAPVPAAGGWRKDAQGSIQLARLDEDNLRRLAQQHAGHYQRIDRADARFELSMNRLDQPLAAQNQENDFHADQWQDEGPWLLLPLLIIAALAFRRGWLMLLMLWLPLSLPQPAHAGWWQTDDQQGYQQYQDEAYDQAAQTFADPNWRAAALYQQGEYQQAAELWAQEDTAEAAYNRGNALARAGDLETAIQAYDQALQRDPQLADAQANKALLEKLKQEQEQQNQDASEQSQDQNQDQQDQQDGESQPQDGDDSQQSQGQPQDQQDENAEQQDSQDQQASEQQQDGSESEQDDPQQAQQPDEATEDDGQQAEATPLSPEQQQADEQAQAVQQWLKRIPDDPGGLLRRKFQRMEQRRQDSQR